ncbi:enoyl-CoA hydratase/isomerase family protein [Bacillus alkalicellulosilyticus]|uniref:enoyl-CoA hydratase/isomerase family protein n=1 Tax=Alkalihalobacterium alkalicellulosilyticum TaxID=1912214 RepID=UPI000997795F|nr:enoyl-CoA hydratase/isomerase family protein [Bacillus alkalicellulosilyticus]
MSKHIDYDVKNHVATITITRPEVKNAIDKTTHKQLFEAFTNANEDKDVKVIVLTGAGDSFSSGADLKSIPLEEVESMDYGDYLKETYNKLLLYLDSIEKPTVAFINGFAAGAGLSLALACDFRSASYDAKFALSFLKIGLVPDAGASFFLPRLVGLSKALELALGDPIAAEEAYRIGLIHQIGEPTALISQLVSQSQTAYGYMKKNMKSSFEHSLADVLQQEVHAQRLAGKTKEHRAAVLSFIQKKKK